MRIRRRLKTPREFMRTESGHVRVDSSENVIPFKPTKRFVRIVSKNPEKILKIGKKRKKGV